LANRAVDKHIPIPLYYQLKEIIQEAIYDMQPGASIPSELEIAEQFNVSRPTVRQALSELVQEGYLYRTKGKGTFVARPKISQDFLSVLESFEHEMRRKEIRPATRVIEFKEQKPDDIVHQHLELHPEAPVALLTRLRFADGEPIVWLHTWLPLERVPGILYHDMENNSLYSVIETVYDLRLSHALRKLEARLAGQYDAELLGIGKGSPVQYIETTTYLVNGKPIEYSQAHYRGDRNAFEFVLTKRAGVGL
jgi:GntR family transcriptional regulator